MRDDQLHDLSDDEQRALLFWLTGYLENNAVFRMALERGIQSQLRLRTEGQNNDKQS